MQSSTYALKSVQDDGEDITIILLAIPKNIYVTLENISVFEGT